MSAKIGIGVILAGGAVLALAGGREIKREADREILARTIWGEARGEGREGMEAVAAVILNRVEDPRWPDTIRGVCLQPWQFSAWNDNDVNRSKAAQVTAEGDFYFRMALEIARDAIEGRLEDPTGGANHYHTRGVNPAWNRDMTKTAELGGHLFFRG